MLDHRHDHYSHRDAVRPALMSAGRLGKFHDSEWLPDEHDGVRPGCATQCHLIIRRMCVWIGFVILTGN
jgi:hypothetical protein